MPETIYCDWGRRTGDTVLTVVKKGDHAVRVHVLASVELVVLEVGNDLLREVLRALLERLDLGRVRALLLEVALDRLHVALEVGEVGLLVERRRLEAERVDDVVDLLGAVLDGLLLLLGGRVGACANTRGERSVTRASRVDQLVRRLADVDVRAGLDGDQLAVDLVDDAVNLLAAQTVNQPVSGTRWGGRVETHMGKASENISSSVMASWNSFMVFLRWEDKNGDGVVGRDWKKS